ncbi:hypothetical protein [Pandoraea sp. PE-S2R-1]|uniref:hypothetical protein n=1 Tax=Pandoraea sp. PE-S2R-1 TaxID=1986994 RepID=UPI000B3F8FA0|nr:hypothetical protein [Pandoraea sp. PE-S2R-1]
MNMKIAFLAATLVTSTAYAMPVFETVKDDVVICNTEAQLHEASQAPSALPVHSCQKVSKGFRFEAMNRNTFYSPPGSDGKPDAMIYGRFLAADNERATPKYFSVMKADVEPVLDAKGNFVEPSCDYPESYVTSKILSAPDGKLYLKQGKVTIKCVNGEMQQTYLPLN